jgi:hypothetical protein
MKLKTAYGKDYNNVYVIVEWPNLKMSWFLVFDYNKFYDRYHPDHQDFINMPLLKEDIVDTYVNVVASVPYTKEEMLKDINVKVKSDLIQMIEL